ncbi:Uu.00g049570.m01.CDS01 [Anthostomella pinea]|uniref:Uu.00g049570.m01.CDS01 n=1 Tax=Anthostomella pinea TaxID=933095 RepID=A0AAI8VBU8_9PEZI|nr:Uu.00g049570.m01.CDS01 [Anthostomella pinea]
MADSGSEAATKRRKLKKRPFKPDVGVIDEPVFSRASVLDNGLIGEKPPSQNGLTRGNGFRPPKEAENNLYALNTLQLARERPLEALNVLQPLLYLQDRLPETVGDQISILTPGPVNVFGGSEANFERRQLRLYGTDLEFWNSIKGAQYVFWPIQAEKGHFVTAIFHSLRGDEADPNFDETTKHLGRRERRVRAREYSRVEAWSVVDPVRSDQARARVTRVRDRIQRIFASEGSITFAPGSYKDSGIRCFALVKQMMQRITDFFCREEGYQEGSYWDPDTSGWLNVDQVRYEMMGVCAINCIIDMDWKARLSVELIGDITTTPPVKKFDAKKLGPDDSRLKPYVPKSDNDDKVESASGPQGGPHDDSSSSSGSSSPSTQYTDSDIDEADDHIY